MDRITNYNNGQFCNHIIIIIQIKKKREKYNNYIFCYAILITVYRIIMRLNDFNNVLNK